MTKMDHNSKVLEKTNQELCLNGCKMKSIKCAVSSLSKKFDLQTRKEKARGKDMLLNHNAFLLTCNFESIARRVT